MKTILIVDDEHDILQTLEMILSLEGYQVLLAYDGKQGLKLLKENHPDLIISDIMMPGMNGFEMTRKIRNQAEIGHIPIIMLSAVPPDFPTLGSKTWDLFIKKPPDLEGLLQAISSLISKYPAQNVS